MKLSKLRRIAWKPDSFFESWNQLSIYKRFESILGDIIEHWTSNMVHMSFGPQQFEQLRQRQQRMQMNAVLCSGLLKIYNDDNISEIKSFAVQIFNRFSKPLVPVATTSSMIKHVSPGELHTSRIYKK